MSLTFPLTTAQFYQLIGVKSITFAPSYGQESSGQGSGLIRIADLRPELWSPTITTRPWSVADSNLVQARLERLQGQLNTFLLYNPYSRYPAAGTFDDSSVQINSLSSDGTGLSLKNCGAGRVITEGDMLSFQYGSRPSYALHRVMETVTADGSGVTAEFAVGGGVRPGATTGTAVKLVEATGEFRIAGSWSPTYDENTNTVSYAFSAIQVL